MIEDRAKIKKHRKAIIIGILIASTLISGGFFPIVNFNPDNPVNLGLILRLMIIVMAFSYCKYIGSLEAIIFANWSKISIGVFNATTVLCGLAFRYLLEFGEVSNTYNFTILNVFFQVITLTMISTIVFVLERKKK